MSIETRAGTVVIGLGNASLSDEGLAARVLREFAQRAPPGVEVVDAGLPGPGLLDLLEGREKAVIVDAVDAGAPPGTVYRFRPEQLTPSSPNRRYSLHDGDVLLYVKLAEVLHMSPKEVVLVGIQPADLSPGESLSPPVEKAVAKAVELALAEVPAKSREGKGPRERVR